MANAGRDRPCTAGTMLIASRSNVHGGGGSSSGTGLRPCCSRSSTDLFARAIGAFGDAARRVLLYFTENFVAAFKARGPRCAASDSAVEPKIGSRCSAGGKREQPSPPSLQQGKSGCSWEGHHLKWGKCLLCQRCLRCQSAAPRVTSRVAREDLCDSRCLVWGSEEDARGATRVRRERL